MRNRIGLTLMLALSTASISRAATKELERPDKEMLRMMEFLKDIEVIKQLDMLQDLHQVETVADPVKNTRVAKPAPAQQKGK